MEVKVRLTMDTAMTLRRYAPVHGVAALVRAEVLRLSPERILTLECAEQGPRTVVTTLTADPYVAARAAALRMKPSRLLRAGANALAERLGTEQPSTDAGAAASRNTAQSGGTT